MTISCADIADSKSHMPIILLMRTFLIFYNPICFVLEMHKSELVANFQAAIFVAIWSAKFDLMDSNFQLVWWSRIEGILCVFSNIFKCSIFNDRNRLKTESDRTETLALFCLTLSLLNILKKIQFSFKLLLSFLDTVI